VTVNKPQFRVCFPMLILAMLVSFGLASEAEARKSPPPPPPIGDFVMWDYRDIVATSGVTLAEYHWWLIHSWLQEESRRPERFVLYATSPTNGPAGGEYATFYDPAGPVASAPTEDHLNFVTFFSLVSSLNATASRGTNQIEIEILLDGSSFQTATSCTSPPGTCSVGAPPALPSSFSTMPCALHWLSTLAGTLETAGTLDALGGLTIDPELPGNGVGEAVQLAVWIDHHVATSPDVNLQGLRYAMTFGVTSKNAGLYTTARFPMTEQNWPHGLWDTAIGDSNAASIHAAVDSNGYLCWRDGDASPILDTVYMQVYAGCSDIGPGNIWQWMNSVDDPTTGNCGIKGTTYTARTPGDAALRLSRLLRGIPQTEGPGTVTVVSDPSNPSNPTHVGITFSADATVLSRGTQSVTTSQLGVSDFLAPSVQLSTGTLSGAQVPALNECSPGAGWKPLVGQGGWLPGGIAMGHGLPGDVPITDSAYLVTEVSAYYPIPAVQDAEMSSRFVFLFSAEEAELENCYGNPFFGHWTYADFSNFAAAFVAETASHPFFGTEVVHDDFHCDYPLSQQQLGIYDLRFACAKWGLSDYPGYAEGKPSSCSAVPPASNCCPYVPHFDHDGDGFVSGRDLAVVLSQWGSCSETISCWADFNFDGVVDVLDLALLLENWGEL
jgi:hypothetical protein